MSDDLAALASGTDGHRCGFCKYWRAFDYPSGYGICRKISVNADGLTLADKAHEDVVARVGATDLPAWLSTNGFFGCVLWAAGEDDRSEDEREPKHEPG